MDKKTIIIVIVATVLAMAGSFGAIWYLTQDSQDAAKGGQDHDAKVGENRRLTSKYEIFNLTLPCKTAADGAFPVVHADMIAEVPLKQLLIMDKRNGKLRDIISGVFRATSIEDINADTDLSFIKKRIIDEVRISMDVDIKDILFLKFSYDIQAPRRES